MTDVTGQIFISYRRSPGRITGDAEASLVCDALRDRGVPTWRDLDDLRPVPTEDEITTTLQSDKISGAVMLVSPEIEASDMVRVVEAPAILDRFKKFDGFILKLVLINVDYRDVDRILDRPGNLQEISHFNIHQVSRSSMGPEDARRIANDVLKERVISVRNFDNSQPVFVGLYSRRTPPPKGYVVCHDFTPYFKDRTTAIGGYSKIETALFDGAVALASLGEKVSIVANGNAALPLGVLFGAIYSPFVFNLVWKQSNPRVQDEEWSLSSGVSDIPSELHIYKNSLDSEELVLAVSINADVNQAASEYLSYADVSPRATISLGLENGPLELGQTLSAQQGLKIVNEAIDAARDLKVRLRMKRANLHLFLACPLSMAVLIGQNLNTFGECVVYEHFSDRKPAYEPAHRFRPSDFTYLSS